MYKSTIKLIHKIVTTKRPPEIVKKLRLQRSRNCCGISIQQTPRTDIFKKNMINKSYQLFNIIPEEIRGENPKKFKESLKKLYVKTDPKDSERYEVSKRRKKKNKNQ